MMRRKIRSGAALRGITLIELIIGMSVVATALVLFGQGYIVLAQLVKQQREITGCQLELSEVYLSLEQDIKDAGSDPLRVGLYTTQAPALQVIPGGQSLAGGLLLRSDRTGASGAPDGDLEDADEVIIYFLDAQHGLLQRWAANGSGGMVPVRLLDHVGEFTPTLLDSSGSLATPATATRVRIAVSGLVSATDPRANAPVRRYVFDIKLRNR